MIYYIYDASGNVIGLKYNNNTYYYEKNIQNDVIGIMDDSFNLLAIYEYDSWGKILSIKDSNGNEITDLSNIALMNPIRYRSYYYDDEINMYYLNSRYYNPEWGRFVNLDSILIGNNIGSFNAYLYTKNNPINFVDEMGNWTGVDDLIAGGIGSIINLTGQFMSDVMVTVLTGNIYISNPEVYIGATMGGFIGGISSLYIGPVGASAITAGSSTLFGKILEKSIRNSNEDPAEILISSSIDASIGAITGVMSLNINKVTTGRNSYASVYKA